MYPIPHNKEIEAKYGPPDEEAHALYDEIDLNRRMKKNATACALHVICAVANLDREDGQKLINIYTACLYSLNHPESFKSISGDEYSQRTRFGFFYDGDPKHLHNGLDNNANWGKTKTVLNSRWAALLCAAVGTTPLEAAQYFNNLGHCDPIDLDEVSVVRKDHDNNPKPHLTTPILESKTPPPQLSPHKSVGSQIKGSRCVSHGERDQRNRELGTAGEKFVVEYECEKLRTAGLFELAKNVEHVAETRGDGLGYDVLSFDESGERLYIEVKTTNGGAKTHFYLTANERRFLEKNSKSAMIYRVYTFKTRTRFFEIRPDDLSRYDMKPIVWRVGV